MRLDLREEPSGSTGRLGSLRPDGQSTPGARARVSGTSNTLADPYRNDGVRRTASNNRPNQRSQSRVSGYSVELLLAMLDLVPVGIIVVDEEHRVELANRCSESVLQRGEVLLVHGDGRIRAADPVVRPTFAAFLRVLFQPNRDSPAEGISKFLFARRGLPPMSVTATRCPSFTVLGAVAGRRALLCLRNLVADGGPPVDNLRALYGLTPAEAQLACALAMGKTIAECSADRGVSVNTTKTHLNALLGKTGLHRQVDLVRLLAAM
ncbi:MAG: helix-turn-helix transcriptional regulator [Betaproteobacteria bacterium]|nr:helix-turn-helix transcriptional regulator [Betaproteobacteria bacterium]